MSNNSSGHPSSGEGEVIRNEPVECGWTKIAVQQFASQVAEKLGYEPGDDMTAIVERLGGTVNSSDWFSENETGSITVNGERNFKIALSPLSGASRSRFTIAHELGHYFLHSKAGRTPLYVRRNGSGRTEWEANWFAAGFLMPEHIFRQKMDEGMSTAELAVYFGVSTEAVEIRKASL